MYLCSLEASGRSSRGPLRTWGWSSTFLIRGQWVHWILSTKMMGQHNECGTHVQEGIISSSVVTSRISTKLHRLRPPVFIISQVCSSRNLAKIWLVSLLKNLLQVTVKMVHKAGILSEGLTKGGYACLQPHVVTDGIQFLKASRLQLLTWVLTKVSSQLFTMGILPCV